MVSGRGIRTLLSLYLSLYLDAEKIITELHINDRSPGRPIHWAPESWLKSGIQPFPCGIVLEVCEVF